jgi:hypothetical protein
MLASRELRSLIEQGLRTIAVASRRKRNALPAYVTVRDYEVGLSSVLTGFGFAPYASRVRFVKHTTATIRRPDAAMVPNAETKVVRQEVPVRSQSLHDGGTSAEPAWDSMQGQSL